MFLQQAEKKAKEDAEKKRKEMAAESEKRLRKMKEQWLLYVVTRRCILSLCAIDLVTAFVAPSPPKNGGVELRNL